MAYMIWCVKNDKSDLLVTGDNHFLEPYDEADLDRAWEQHVCYLAVDTMLEMLRSDVFKMVRGGKDKYIAQHGFGGWIEGIGDALDALGWKICDEYNDDAGVRCEVEVSWTSPHGQMHQGEAQPGVIFSWPVEEE
jgi:hypothetical protein